MRGLPVRKLSLVLLGAACVHVPTPESGSVTDPVLVERFAKDLSCARDQVEARGQEEIVADGCGRIARYGRKSDGSWALASMVDVNAGKPIPFMGPLAPPRRLSGQEPKVTQEALDAHADGLFIGECVITVEGDARDCVVEKSLERWDHAILAALATWKYQPATYRGQPVAVRYKIHVHIALPR